MSKIKAGDFLIYLVLGLVFGVAILNMGIEAEPQSATFEPKVHFLDVGQGDATLVEISDDTQLLVDGGPDKSLLNELGKLMPFEDRKIEYIILSHAHADHFMGLVYLLERYEIGQIYLTDYGNKSSDFLYFMERVKEKNIKTIVVGRGDVFSLDNLEVYTFWPPKGGIIKDLNDASLVFYLSYPEALVLFTGDVSYQILDKIKGDLRPADILKVSHHGSRTGTSSEFVNVVQSRFAIISVGQKNRFGHPHSQVLSLLKNMTILKTDRDGTVSFILGRAGIGLP
ncbi:MBL fold metallo-hydrolase [Patescibacteria group bacterium]|nr:MBL fold metallo-hydrolase [Patescibacteria group bacterium]